MCRSKYDSVWFCIYLIFNSSLLIAQDQKPVNTANLSSIQMGIQVWSSENLSVSVFRNGDPIPEVTSPQEWSRAAKEHRPAWCFYDNDSEKGRIQGKLYNWYAVTDLRGLAPEGWHIPSQPELHTLVNYLDAYFSRFNYRDSLFVSGLHASPENSLYASQGGYRLTNGEFANFGQYGFWWGSTCYLSSDAWLKLLRSGNGFKVTNIFHHGDGFSLRCIKN